MTELLRVLGHILCGVVGEPGGLGSAGAGDNAHTGANDGGNDHRPEHPLVFLLGDLAVVLADGTGLGVQVLMAQLRFADDFHQGEKADEGHRQIQP